MKTRLLHLLGIAVVALSAAGAPAQDKATKDAAQKLYTEGESNPDQTKGIRQICQASGMVPKNQQWAGECSQGKSTLIAGDKRSLNTAQDLADAGKTEQAIRKIGEVSDLDPATYQKAKDLLAKLKAPKGPDNAALLAKAQGAFDAGDLQAARTVGGQVTDGSATHLLNEIDRYLNLVREAQQEETSSPSQAITNYKTALAVNAHVGNDDLNGRIQRLQKQMAVVTPPPPPPQPQPAQAQPQATQPQPQPQQPKPAAGQTPGPAAPKQPEPSLDDKKKKLVDAYTVALGRNDLDGQERSLKQIVQLDPRDQDAKSKLKDVQDKLLAALNRDPVKLESTLREAVAAFYASDFDSAESKLNNYLRAGSAKKKGAAYFYLGATEQAEALLQTANKRASRLSDARDNFKQAREAGYQPVQKYVSEKILLAWGQAGL